MNFTISDTFDIPNLMTISKDAFPAEESPVIMDIIEKMLASTTTPKAHILVAQEDGATIGYCIFSPVTFMQQETSSNGTSLAGYILAPLAVASDHQKKGVAASLVKEGIAQLKEQGVDVLFVYGDPNYYGRFGFSVDFGAHFAPIYPLSFPMGWQGMALQNDSSLPTEQTPLQFKCIAGLDAPEVW